MLAYKVILLIIELHLLYGITHPSQSDTPLHSGVTFVKPTCCKDSGTALDCENCNLRIFPSDFLRNKTSLTMLDLSNNKISHIPDGSFQGLRSLKKLVLVENPVLSYNKDIFEGLEALEHLEIGYSAQDFEPSMLAADTLSFLTNLKVLRLHYIYGKEFEPWCLKPLQQLQILEMAITHDTILGDEFENLTMLQSLRIKNIRSEYYGFFNLTAKSLAAVRDIKELQISHILKEIPVDALTHFQRLSKLSLLCNQRLRLPNVFAAIKRMPSPTLTTLILDGCTDREFFRLTPDLLDSDNFRGIVNMSLKHTHLVQIDASISLLLPNLRNLAINYNSVLVKNNHTEKEIIKILNTVRLESFDISSIFQQSPAIADKFEDTYCRHTRNTFKSPPEFLNLADYKIVDPVMRLTSINNSNGVWKFIPPSLRYLFGKDNLIMSQNKDVYVANRNNLLFIDLSNTKLTRSPLLVGFDKLQGFDLSNMGLRTMPMSQLNHMKSLRYLNLSSNWLHKMDLNRFLAGGSNLSWLDLGYNNIQNLSLSPNSLPNIQNLSLAGNPLLNFTLQLENKLKLINLNLSNCALKAISKSFMEGIDSLQSMLSHTPNLDLSNNAFECSCSTLDVISWFQNTQVHIVDRDSIACLYKNTSIPLLTVDVGKMSRECDKNSSLKASVVLIPVAICLGFSAIAAFIYKFKWHLKWHIYKASIAIKHASSDVTESSSFAYDVYIVYEPTQDFQWVENELITRIKEKWGFNFCIDRTFDPGRSVFKNWETAISMQQSQNHNRRNSGICC